jgi:hypothetical protein
MGHSGYAGTDGLPEACCYFPSSSPNWVEAYRDLCEWATLYDLVCHHDFAADTLVVRDGLLRTTIFGRDMLVRTGRLMRTAIDLQARRHHRRVWLVGLAKKTKVLDRYRLAMSLAGVFDRGTPCFVQVPAALQQADAHSRVADLDVALIEDSLVDAVRELVGCSRAGPRPKTDPSSPG